jgi:uncharacterized protein
MKASFHGDNFVTKTQIIQIFREQQAYLRTEFGVENIGLFGSYSQDNARPDSDIDLVIEFSRPIGFRFMELAAYLENILDAPVDILTPAGIDNIRFPDVAANIQDSVAYV